MKAQSSTFSGLSASRQQHLTVAVNILLNDGPPENQFSAYSDSGDETDARVSRHSTK